MNYIKGLNRWLLIFMFILPTILLLVFDFYFFEIPEIFEGANKIGKIIYGLLFSLMTAYVFYIATVYTPEYRLKSSIDLGLKPMLGDIVTYVDNLVKRISKQSGIQLNRNSSLKEIESALVKIQINSKPPKISQYETVYETNWLVLFTQHLYSMEKVIDKITKRYSTTMEPSIISILHTIETSGFAQIVLLMKNSPSGGDLKSYSSEIKSYFEIINQLESSIKNSHKGL